jgi:hypothetical protein
MPYRFLPDDFPQKYRSVWVDVPSQLFDPEKGHQLYNEFLDEMEYAEQMGFDGICCNEHHNNAIAEPDRRRTDASHLTCGADRPRQ